MILSLVLAQSVCPPGQVTTNGHCCWPGQTWVSRYAACAGPPMCPVGMMASGLECVDAPALPPPPPEPPRPVPPTEPQRTPSPTERSEPRPEPTDAATLPVDEGVPGPGPLRAPSPSRTPRVPVTPPPDVPRDEDRSPPLSRATRLPAPENKPDIYEERGIADFAFVGFIDLSTLGSPPAPFSFGAGFRLDLNILRFRRFSVGAGASLGFVTVQLVSDFVDPRGVAETAQRTIVFFPLYGKAGIRIGLSTSELMVRVGVIPYVSFLTGDLLLFPRPYTALKPFLGVSALLAEATRAGRGAFIGFDLALGERVVPLLNFGYQL